MTTTSAHTHHIPPLRRLHIGALIWATFLALSSALRLTLLPTQDWVHDLVHFTTFAITALGILLSLPYQSNWPKNVIPIALAAYCVHLFTPLLEPVLLFTPPSWLYSSSGLLAMVICVGIILASRSYPGRGKNGIESFADIGVIITAIAAFLLLGGAAWLIKQTEHHSILQQTSGIQAVLAGTLLAALLLFALSNRKRIFKQPTRLFFALLWVAAFTGHYLLQWFIPVLKLDAAHWGFTRDLLFDLSPILALLYLYSWPLSGSSVHTKASTSHIYPLLLLGVLMSVIAVPAGIWIGASIGQEVSTPILLWTSLGVGANICLRLLLSLIRSQRVRTQLQHEASHDALTGLLNRRGFLEKAQDSIDRPRTLAFLDIDRFKATNDNYSHTIGDAVLRHVSNKLFKLDKRILKARFGGDEFALLLPAYITDPETFCQELAQELKDTYEHDGLSIAVNVSVGHSLRKVATTEILLNEADRAMYVVKRSRGADPLKMISNAASRKARRFQQLRQILSDGELELFCQPVYQLHSGNPNYLEILARFGPHGQQQLPYEFFSEAPEREQLWQLLTRAVATKLQEADPMLRNSNISINLPSSVAGDLELLEALDKTLQQSGYVPQRVTFELQRTPSTQTYALANNLGILRNKGYRLALDGLGDDQAPLIWLNEIGFDYIKFSRRLMQTPSSANLVAMQHLTQLAQKLHSEVVLTGIENAEQFSLAQKLNADSVQGHYCCQPVPLSKWRQALRRPLSLIPSPQKKALNRRPEIAANH